jgi:hypothetical protein
MIVFILMAFGICLVMFPDPFVMVARKLRREVIE